MIALRPVAGGLPRLPEGRVGQQITLSTTPALSQPLSSLPRTPANGPETDDTVSTRSSTPTPHDEPSSSSERCLPPQPPSSSTSASVHHKKLVPISVRSVGSSSSNEHWVRAGGSVWPGQSHWKETKRARDRKNRSCGCCMARLGKRARFAVKLAIAALVVGIAVGVGFGISRFLGQHHHGR